MNDNGPLETARQLHVAGCIGSSPGEAQSSSAVCRALSCPTASTCSSIRREVLHKHQMSRTVVRTGSAVDADLLVSNPNSSPHAREPSSNESTFFVIQSVGALLRPHRRSRSRPSHVSNLTRKASTHTVEETVPARALSLRLRSRPRRPHPAGPSRGSRPRLHSAGG